VISAKSVKKKKCPEGHYKHVCKLLIQKTVVKMNEKEKALLVGVEWEAFQFSLAVINPLLFNQLLFVRIIEPIDQLNGPFADSCDKTNFPNRLHLAQQVTGKINRPSSNRNGTTTVSNSMLSGCDYDVPTDRLHIRRQIEVVAISNEKIFWSG